MAASWHGQLWCQIKALDESFFSLPERNALGELLWSLTIRHRSHHPSTIFKQHLLLNHWASSNHISQDWSLGDSDWKMFKDFESMQDSGCHGNHKKKKKKKKKPALWLSCRASALWSGGCGFDPRPGFTKDFKNDTSCSFTWRSALRK